MSFVIECGGFCIKGPRRQKNEDNLLCDGVYLPLKHIDDDIPVKRFDLNADKWMAVFDGIGGEPKGEKASYTAARSLSEQASKECDINNIVDSLNESVLECARNSKVTMMGTTVAALCFADKKITGFNVGDSRCYHFSDGRMERMSSDHAKYAGTPQHRLLTQYIGVKKSDFIITPYQFTREYHEGDTYMLCTDGLTDFIIDRRISDIINAKIPVSQQLEILRERIAKRGTPDNATVLIARIIDKTDKQI